MDLLNLHIKDLQDLILFLIPGFLFVLSFFYQIPDRRKSDFTIIFFSVVISLFINYVTSGLVALVNFITNLKTQISFGFDSSLWFTLPISIIFSILATRFIKSDLFRRVSKKLFRVDSAPFGRVWNNFFQVNKITVLRVCLNDGVTYIGKLDKASIDPDDDVQELTLKDPYYFEVKNGKSGVRRVKETALLFLDRSSIRSIEKIKSKEAGKLYDL